MRTRTYWFTLTAFFILAAGGLMGAQNCNPPCIAPDNGGGTADLPAQCPFVNIIGTFDIIDGLPAGTEINSNGKLHNFFNIQQLPGGSLGGGYALFGASLSLKMQGKGTLGGYSRSVTIPIGSGARMDHAPRVPGTSPQSFDSDMFRLNGQLPPGDPDFDLLRITAGTDFGLPSPGHTTLTVAGGGTWNVESFFDITYRIDFVGAPGGPLAGRAGSTTGTIHISNTPRDTVYAGSDLFTTPAGGLPLIPILQPCLFPPGSLTLVPIRFTVRSFYRVHRCKLLRREYSGRLTLWSDAISTRCCRLRQVQKKSRLRLSL